MSASDLWRLGFGSPPSQWENAMQRVDGAYLYELGAELRPIASMEEKATTKLSMYVGTHQARDTLQNFVANSVYSGSVRLIRDYASELVEELGKYQLDFADSSSWDNEVPSYQIASLKAKFQKLEATLIAELRSSPLYLVHQKGGFSIECLTERPVDLFPEDLLRKVPEAATDVTEATKAIAFELNTAAAFHLHRVHEATFRAYFKAVGDGIKAPRTRNMGDYLKALRDGSKGDEKVLASVQAIKDLHRNPIMHPEQQIESTEEAINLHAAVRAAVGYMLPPIPLRLPQEADDKDEQY